MKDSERILQSAIRQMLDEEAAGIPSNEELAREEEAPSRSFERRMRRLIRGQNRRYRYQIVAQRTAAAIALLILAYGFLLLANEDVRAITFRFFRNLVENGMTSYSISGTGEADTEHTFKGIELTYIPEGFEKVPGLEEFSDSNSGMWSYALETEDQRYYQLDCIYFSNEGGSSSDIDNEHSTLEHLQLEDGSECDFYRCTEAEYASYLIWRKDNLLFNLSITSYLDGWEDEELIRTANGIRIIYE